MKGRPPVTGRESGPDAYSALITATMISTPLSLAREPARWRLEDLPLNIAARVTVHPVSGCWIVGGAPDRNGYARIGGRGAHRVIWEELVGEIPAGLVLDHREDWGCLSKACGWPGHLIPVTQFVNSTRAGAGGVAAVNIRKTHCGACGAAYDLYNTYTPPGSSRRDCRRCIARRTREYKARQRGAAITMPPSAAGFRRAA